MLLVEGVEHRHFGAAGHAPGGPEIDDHHMAALGGEIESGAGQGRHGERRRRLGGYGAGQKGRNRPQNQPKMPHYPPLF
jgi:hypothetical protein